MPIQKDDYQTKVLEAMTHEGFYPHPVESITRCETHISTVFLTGSFVYKIKKPVDLGFLDFSSLEKRQYYCRQEVALNRRLSHDVYIKTLPITAQEDGYTLSGPGVPVEFTVKMHQLAESDSMLQRLQHNTLDQKDIEELISLLVGFYTQTSTDSTISSSGDLAWEENLQEVEPFTDVWVDRQQLAFVRSKARLFYFKHKCLFRRRRQEGKIRDCHGDLRTDHVYFTKNGIQIIDCIEFNDRLRYLDIISDLAFLTMDLEYNHFSETAWTLIRLYLKHTKDIGALPLLNFYRCYRAMVRCKVSCFHLLECGGHNTKHDTMRTAAQAYLNLAHDYAAALNRPILWVVYGLPASGKSTMAKRLAAVFDIRVIPSDVIRKKLFADSSGSSVESAFGQGIYSAYATKVTYGHMFAQAREDLKKGESVVIDATFSQAVQRAETMRIAACLEATPVFVECRASDSILAERLLQRENTPSVSDARLVHLPAFKKRFEPLDRMGNEIHIIVDTENPPAVCLQQILLTEALWNGATPKGGKYV